MSNNKNTTNNGRKHSKYYEKRIKKAKRNKRIFTIVSIIVLVLLISCIIIFYNRKKEPKENIVTTTTVVPVTTEEITTTTNELGKIYNDDVSNAINGYFIAKEKNDSESYKEVVNNPSSEDISNLNKEHEFIEAYKNIDIKLKKGLTDSDFVAYVYYEVKFKNIDTAAPGIVVLYVEKNNDLNKYQIYAYEHIKTINDYVLKLNNDKDVKEFFNDANEKYIAACDKDEKLKNFCENLSNAE